MNNLKNVRATRIEGKLVAFGKVKSLNEMTKSNATTHEPCNEFFNVEADSFQPTKLMPINAEEKISLPAGFDENGRIKDSVMEMVTLIEECNQRREQAIKKNKKKGIFGLFR